MYGFDCTNHTARYNEKINAENNYRYRVDLNELVQTEDEKQLLKDVENMVKKAKRRDGELKKY